MKLIFMGTPEFAIPALEALLHAQSRSPLEGERARASGNEAQAVGGKNYNIIPPTLRASSADSLSAAPPQGGSKIEIVGAYTQPPRPKGRGQQEQRSPVHVLAEKHSIPVFTPTSLKSAEAQAEFASLKPDVAIVVAYGLLLPQAILDTSKYGCINIHPSSLPRWRGAAPIQRSIMAGDTSTEICIMQMDQGLDTGAVLRRSTPITIPPHMNVGELHDRLAEDAAPLLLQTLDEIAAGKAVATPQSTQGVTYANKITKDECRIDWRKPAAAIHNHIRGLSPSPGAYCMLGGEMLKVFKATIKTTPPQAGGIISVPGTVLDNALTIGCGDGSAIQLLEVQKAGKARMPIDAFLRGQPVAQGSILE